jgi:peroxiredoxin
LSDEDRSVGARYGARRPDDDPAAGYALRISYLIDPDGRIAKAYEVSDPAGHPGEVLDDLRGLTAAAR